MPSQVEGSISSRISLSTSTDSLNFTAAQTRGPSCGKVLKGSYSAIIHRQKNKLQQLYNYNPTMNTKLALLSLLATADAAAFTFGNNQGRASNKTSKIQLKFGFLKDLGLEKPGWLPDFGGKEAPAKPVVSVADVEASALEEECADEESEAAETVEEAEEAAP